VQDLIREYEEAEEPDYLSKEVGGAGGGKGG
jgi:hypothetical protein